MSKQYGLIIPNKNKKLLGGISITRPSIFDEDSDSDTPKLTKPTGLARARKQDKINQGKALKEDPTVFQYDEVYDKIEQEKMESKLAKKDKDKKPKYINHLLAAAERRKRENERRVEKQVQKEREAEGEQFKDKESFVTSSYKKKLEELKALEEQEKREEYLEAIGDVTKQGNLDGFYRHLYDQKVNYEDKIKDESDTSKQEIKEEKESDNENSGAENKRRKRTSRDGDKTDSESEERIIKKNPGAKKRKYRSRKDSANGKSDSESEPVEVKKEHLQSNLDADSDFSIDSSSDSEKEEKQNDNKENNTKEKNTKIENEGEKLQLPEKGNVLSDNVALAKKHDDKDNKNDTKDGSKDEQEQKETNEKDQEEVKPKKPKIDIWKKRTVGEVFDEALKRYFERKAARDAERRV